MSIEPVSEPGFRFDNSYARLPDRFYARVQPVPVAAPGLVKINETVAAELGLDAVALSSSQGLAILAGNVFPAGAEPLAMAYAGHQFGGFSPQLGDGRALLLGEVRGRDGRRRDIHLKGSGPTPFSRRGDGRAALGPVLREYIVSEAMAALGIPTTRTLAAVTTGEAIRREGMQPGAVLARVALSHVRVGTFQYFAARDDVEGVRLLADHVLARLYPHLMEADNRYLALLKAVIERQAALIASWLHIGFIHGVMNTDNMAISGETIDYGPCAFMDEFHPDTVYSSIDHQGRYAYANQPSIAQWNLARLAETMLPLIDSDEQRAIEMATKAVERFAVHFVAAYVAGLRRKLGLLSSHDDDMKLINDLLGRMSANRADFTLTFRGLADAAIDPAADAKVARLFAEPEAFHEWAAMWRSRLAAESGHASERRANMLAANPLFIARNHLVEEAIRAAVDMGDLAPFEQLVEVLQRPFDDQPDRERFTRPPRPDEVVHATFCGT